MFDYDSLPRNMPRRFVPPDFKFEWADISRLYERLGSRNLESLQDLMKWLADEAEFDAVISELRNVRYINYTRQTDDAAYQKAYEDYTEHLEPKIKLASFQLLQKYIACPLRAQLPQASYGLENRRREAALRVFRAENVELERQESFLAQDFQKTAGAMTVQFRGEERTLQQMSKFYEQPDRPLRKEAWTAADGRALRDAEALDVIYDKMIGIRDSIARNAGFANYEDYVFVRKDRFDYTPDDCLLFHRAVEESMVPLSREIDEERRAAMGLDTLMPWDTRVDPLGRAPLAPFRDSDALISGASKVVKEVDPKFSGYFAKMSQLSLLDLQSRKGKAPGGYQEELAEVGLPFIFMNASGRDSDVRTLLHECGHSFQTFLMHEKGLPYFNSGANLPLEFAEVASMSMELISGEHMAGTFYDEAGARRSNREELISIVKLFTWVATIDAFQHWVYSHPAHSHEERARAWRATFTRFSGLESYEGLDRSLDFRWQRQLHLFEVPFYYIEYGIASIGALGVWLRYRKDRRKAIEDYQDALSLGATKPLPELFAAAGVEWGLGPRVIGRLAAELRSAIREFS